MQTRWISLLLSVGVVFTAVACRAESPEIDPAPALEGHERIAVKVVVEDRGLFKMVGIRKERFTEYILDELQRAGIDTSTKTADPQDLSLRFKIVTDAQANDSFGGVVFAFAVNVDVVQLAVLNKSQRSILVTTPISQRFRILPSKGIDAGTYGSDSWLKNRSGIRVDFATFILGDIDETVDEFAKQWKKHHQAVKGRPRSLERIGQRTLWFLSS
jgi:hypothetical protein